VAYIWHAGTKAGIVIGVPDCRREQAAQCRAGVLVGERVQIGRIGSDRAEDLAKEHGHDHRAHERKSVQARSAGGHLAARLGMLVGLITVICVVAVTTLALSACAEATISLVSVSNSSRQPGRTTNSTHQETSILRRKSKADPQPI
jgi:hypothetical protein